MVNRSSEEIDAAYAFQNKLEPDVVLNEFYPLWYGWALKDAFFAGIDYARKQSKES